MMIRKQTTKDTKSINRWLQARGLSIQTNQSLHSFIVPGVAAGQLLICEPSLLIFDSYVTNPHVSSSTRDKALDSLTQFLIDYGKKLGATQMLAFSGDERTLLRAKRLGFIDLPYSMVVYKG